MRKVLLCLLFLSFGYFYVQSQTVVWQMPPTGYSKIIRIASNLYQVERNGKIGLVHSDGTIVAPANNDKIGGFYEHKALVTSNDGYGERVTGCLTDDGNFYSFTNKYYTLNGQKFFSDDVLSVADQDGLLGYIDYRGNVVTGFDGKYDRIKPFVEGYAAVFKNKKYFLIDKTGIPVHFSFKTVGEIYGGTNVYNGLVYVWDTEGSFYTYDVYKKGVCKSVKAPSDKRSLDYLYRFSCISGKGKEIPFSKTEIHGVKGLAPVKVGDVYGYGKEGNTVLPYQLASASQFEDELAVVKHNGRLGILKYIEGQSFSLTVPTSNIVFYLGDVVTCIFNLSIPEVWANKGFDVILKDENGTIVSTTNSADSFRFQVKVAKSCKKAFSISVYGDNLKLYESDMLYSFTMKERCPICGLDKANCHGHISAPKPVKHQTHTVIKKEKLCPTCGKPISVCKYQGVH